MKNLIDINIFVTEPQKHSLMKQKPGVTRDGKRNIVLFIRYIRFKRYIRYIRFIRYIRYNMIKDYINS